ncbi:hypothetical protein SORBI_3002G349400 [Sorghum bicolor]|uniref:Uncharacterized protein n=1 Tax=Sorghum bicolor TaxID=4558 RepID=A0A1B6QF47_SORBI|nr:hypothetical protein SORBI_3002G349400 [Sorghum bicolor]
MESAAAAEVCPWWWYMRRCAIVCGGDHVPAAFSGY